MDEKKLKYLAIALMIIANILFVGVLILPRFGIFTKFPLSKIYLWIFMSSLFVIFIRNTKIRENIKNS